MFHGNRGKRIVVNINVGTTGMQTAGGSISAPGTVTVTGRPGARRLITDTRVVTINGTRIVVRDGHTRTAEGWRLTGTPTGIQGTEI